MALRISFREMGCYTGINPIERQKTELEYVSQGEFTTLKCNES